MAKGVHTAAMQVKTEKQQAEGRASAVVSPPKEGERSNEQPLSPWTKFPLESLPKELIDMVISHVVGNKTIHVGAIAGGTPGEPVKQFKLNICENGPSGAVVYNAIADAYRTQQVRPVWATFELHLGVQLNTDISRPCLDLSIMQTNREIYQNSRDQLWHTNLFRFTRAETFQAFMEVLNQQQKSNIRNLQFLRYDSLHNRWSHPREEAYFSAFSEKILRDLIGVHLVDIRIDATFYPDRDNPKDNMKPICPFIDNFLLLSRLPAVETVSVIIRKVKAVMEEDPERLLSWDTGTRIKYAEKMVNIIKGTAGNSDDEQGVDSGESHDQA